MCPVCPVWLCLCAEAQATTTKSSLELSCSAAIDSGIVSSVHFASYGLADGTCGAYSAMQCHSEATRAVVEAACVGKAACSFDLSLLQQTFGHAQPCDIDLRELSLTIQLGCVHS